MPRQQLELAPGELVAREARSHDDLPDGRRRRPEGQLADGVRWVAGRGWRPRRGGVVAPTRGVDPSMQRTSPPSCSARGHRPIFAARGRLSARELRSAKWCQSKFYDSDLCHIAPRVLHKCLVHALSALVENMKVLMGCEYWCEAPNIGLLGSEGIIKTIPSYNGASGPSQVAGLIVYDTSTSPSVKIPEPFTLL